MCTSAELEARSARSAWSSRSRWFCCAVGSASKQSLDLRECGSRRFLAARPAHNLAVGELFGRRLLHRTRGVPVFVLISSRVAAVAVVDAVAKLRAALLLLRSQHRGVRYQRKRSGLTGWCCHSHLEVICRRRYSCRLADSEVKRRRVRLIAQRLDRTEVCHRGGDTLCRGHRFSAVV